MWTVSKRKTEETTGTETTRATRISKTTTSKVRVRAKDKKRNRPERQERPERSEKTENPNAQSANQPRPQKAAPTAKTPVEKAVNNSDADKNHRVTIRTRKNSKRNILQKR